MTKWFDQLTILSQVEGQISKFKSQKPSFIGHCERLKGAWQSQFSPLLYRNELKVLCQYLYLDAMAKHQQDQDASADSKGPDVPIRCANRICANPNYLPPQFGHAH